MYNYRTHNRANPGLIARVNNHSLTTLEEMLDFTLRENIYDANRVNDQVAAWASRVNLNAVTGMTDSCCQLSN